MTMIWAYVGGAALVLGFGTGWKVRDWKADAAEKARLEAVLKTKEENATKVDAAAVKFEDRKAKVAARERVVIKEVERVVEKPVYRNICVDSDGLRILADDVAASNTGRELAPAVPAASSPQ